MLLSLIYRCLLRKSNLFFLLGVSSFTYYIIISIDKDFLFSHFLILHCLVHCIISKSVSGLFSPAILSGGTSRFVAPQPASFSCEQKGLQR